MDAPAPGIISPLPSFATKGQVFMTRPMSALQALLSSQFLHSIGSPRPFRRKDVASPASSFSSECGFDLYYCCAV